MLFLEHFSVVFFQVRYLLLYSTFFVLQDAELGADGDTDGGVESPQDVKQNIKAKFLMEMPDDFYEFWQFAKSVNSSHPEGL